jgi:hypothetical protein
MSEAAVDEVRARIAELRANADQLRESNISVPNETELALRAVSELGPSGMKSSNPKMRARDLRVGMKVKELPTSGRSANANAIGTIAEIEPPSEWIQGKVMWSDPRDNYEWPRAFRFRKGGRTNWEKIADPPQTGHEEMYGSGYEEYEE